MTHTNRLALALSMALVCLSCQGGARPTGPGPGERFEFAVHGDASVVDTGAISDSLDAHYERILGDLGVRGMPVVTVGVWTDRQAFLDDMEATSGARYSGVRGYIVRPNEIRLLQQSDIAHVAVHEFAHLVSMQVNPAIPNSPRWLWEAVAVYEAGEFVDPRTLDYMTSGDYPGLEELNATLEVDYKIYRVGYVLIEYVVSNWGMDAVIGLIETNGDIAGQLGISPTAFEAGWHLFVEDKYIEGSN